MKELAFAKGLSLPLDAVTQKFAFPGRSGSGKTYGSKRLVESLLGAKAQVVILDPVGVWHGLRVGPGSFNIPVLGGLHADLPLAGTSGAGVARLVCERSLSVVLDVSQMHDAERTRFAEAFGREFFQLKKAAPSPVMLALEELQEFAPQNPNPGEQMMLHEFQRIAKLGRNFGIGILGISQRPQECSKKLLNQTECVVAFQMTGPQERKALEYWLSDRGIETKDLGKLLPTLEVGRPLLWSPQWLKRREVVEILPIATSDTSQTPKFGSVASTFELKPIDVKMLRAELESVIEEASKDDPKALRRRIDELEKQLAQKPTAAAPTFDIAQVHKILDGADAVLATLEQKLSWITNELSQMVDLGNSVTSTARDVEALAENQTYTEQLRELLKTTKRPVVAQQPLPQQVRVKIARTMPVESGALLIKLAKVDRTLLTVLATHGPLSRERAAMLAGYPVKTSTTQNSAIHLRSIGFISGTNERMSITPEGRKHAGNVESPPSKPAELLEWWCKKLAKVDREILHVLAKRSRPMLFNELSVAAGYDPVKSTAQNSVINLRSLGLINGKNSEGISIAADLREPRAK